MKLASVTRIGLKPLSADPECEVKHVNGKLVLILVKHVDDLKIAGEEKEVQLLLKSLGEVFGKSDRNNNDFTCVGIHHHRKPDGTIILDQNGYISALKQIHHPDITGKPLEADCSETVTRLYWSLLGAVAYTLLTQHWIAVYIIHFKDRHTSEVSTYSQTEFIGKDPAKAENCDCIPFSAMR